MRKFLFIFAVITSLMCVVACSSCSNEDTPWGIEYSLTSDGKTDASVTVEFVNGSFVLNGDANYAFSWSNVDNLKVFNGKFYDLDSVAETDDLTLMTAYGQVNDWLNMYFKVADFKGHYDIYLKGYVRETKTQITFSINRHFTNIPEDSE